jgi:hypothetical protein
MTPREKLQRAYELAFYPPRLNQTWNRIRDRAVEDPEALREMVHMALLLHLALPEEGVASQRALKRLALYQAKSRSYGMVRFLRNVAKALHCPMPSSGDMLPGHMVRDNALPSWTHKVRNPL